MNKSEFTLTDKELEELFWAHKHLEHPSFAARLSNTIGSPIEKAVNVLPKSWNNTIRQAVEGSIQQALKTAISSMDRIAPQPTHDYIHKILATGAGAVSGFFGPWAVLAELPITTTLMLRTIADIAHSHGEELETVEARMACMEVFALGGRSHEDDASETGYYGIRAAMAMHFSHFFITLNGNETFVPGSLNFIRAITSRFGIVISDKTAAQMIPVAGAIMGGLINLVFMQHFQDMARGHFILRRLERKYGSEFIRDLYENISSVESEAKKEYSLLEGW